MRDQNENMKKKVYRRSMLLSIISVPMMLVASFSRESMVCLIIVIVYLVLLLLNGISCLPLLKEFMGRKNKTK
ncbi:MAG: hypothetical protein IKI56_10405 [Ruminococcus sp.]|nr:hypothetical protein [Ruminococcus sp.]